MNKKTLSAVFIVISVFFTATYASAQSADWSRMSDYLSGLGISRETSDDLKNLIEHRSEPIIRNVTISNDEPLADEPVTVTATIVSPPDMTGDDIGEATLNYSADNGLSWESVAMEQDADDNSVWTGTIPGRQSGSNIIFGVQATNFSDESAIEVACKTDAAPPKGAEQPPAGCENDKSPELCEAKKPAGCLFPLAISSDEFKSYENESSTIPDDLNIRAPRVGYDDGKLYIDIPVKGKISPGLLSPTNIHVYVAGWVNPDRGGSETGLDAIFKQGATVIYAPLNPTEQCAIYSLRTSAMDIDRTSALCLASGNRLVFSMKKKVFDPNPSKTLEFLLLTFNQRELSHPDVKLEDSSIITRVYFVDRGYSVQ